MYNLEQLRIAMLDVVKVANIFKKEDIDWIESILYRNDNQPGQDQLLPVIKGVEEYVQKRSTMTPVQDYVAQKELNNHLWACKIQYYKQKRILIGTAQRKKHPKADVPNLFGLIAPQHVRVDVTTVIGLGYCESREHLVKQALSNPAITHLLFVDDDILLPLDAVARLADANLPIVGALYTKRNPTLESVATTVLPDAKYGLGNYIVQPEQGKYTPVPVGCTGLGATMVDVDVFKKVPAPWFQFIHETLPDGSKGRLLVGEDSRFIQYCAQHGIQSSVIPGVAAVHVDLKTGQHYGPEWLVDYNTKKIRPEFENRYTKFAVDPRECYTEDIDPVFKTTRPAK